MSIGSMKSSMILIKTGKESYIDSRGNVVDMAPASVVNNRGDNLLNGSAADINTGGGEINRCGYQSCPKVKKGKRN